MGGGNARRGVGRETATVGRWQRCPALRAKEPREEKP